MIYKPEYTIYDKKFNIPIIGYYHRPWRKDMLTMFVSFLRNLKQKVRLYIMNMNNKPLFNNCNTLIKDLHFTNDPIDFWSNVSHFFYGMDNCIDPWPTTLQEAVNFNKQIIIYKKNQNFEDGKNDILECIDYHTDLTDKYLDNSDSLLNIVNFDKIYKDPEGYKPEEKTFKDYLEKYL
jgi:hypothetical protein